jgi:CRP-like cAMP-binding protein
VETRRIALFAVLADLPVSELEELAGVMGELRVEAGTEVVTIEDQGTAVYFVEDGEAEVTGDGDAVPETLGAGDAFGEIGLLLTGERTATVRARTPMRLLSLSGQDFERIRARVPELEHTLRRIGVERAGT